MEVSLDCTYRRDGHSEKWPLPWGVARIERWARVSGHPRSSRAGAWYFKVPAFAMIGYGLYQPYIEFLFRGTVERTSRRDDIPGDGAGFRMGSRTWLYFRGQIRPTPRALLEQRLGFKYYYPDLGTAAEVLPLVGNQGHLSLRSLSGEEILSEIRLMERISSSLRLQEVFPHRRRILNHQVFGGGVRVYFLPHVHAAVHGMDGAPDQLQWLVWVPKEAEVVSPDHLDQPIYLARGLYWAAHPRPTPGKGVD